MFLIRLVCQHYFLLFVLSYSNFSELFRRRKLKFLHLYAKSTEDRQLDQIRALRQALVKKRKLSAASCAVALSSFRCGMVLSTRRATRPQEFNFALEKRLRGTKSESGAASTWKKLDFVGDLRKPIDHKVALYF